MRTSTASARRLPDMTSTAFLIIAFLTGIAGALQTPTLSLFLTSQVYVSPFMVGIFFTGSAVIGIFVSQLLATWSDKRGDRKTLILYCCLLGALACVLFAFNRNYLFCCLSACCYRASAPPPTPRCSRWRVNMLRKPGVKR